MTLLRNKLNDAIKKSAENMSPEIRNLLDQAKQELINSDVLKGSLNIGDIVQEFTLLNQNGSEKKLSDYTNQGLVIISFYRGSWCPYCNIEIQALQEILPQIKNNNASLIAISPQLPDGSLSFKEKNNLEFDVLSDLNNKIAHEFGLVFSIADYLKPIYIKNGLDFSKINGDDSFLLPIPATYIINENMQILYKFADPDYTKRSEPGDILQILQAHNKK
jgi:peroxiredoxin